MNASTRKGKALATGHRGWATSPCILLCVLVSPAVGRASNRPWAATCTCTCTSPGPPGLPGSPGPPPRPTVLFFPSGPPGHKSFLFCTGRCRRRWSRCRSSYLKASRLTTLLDFLDSWGSGSRRRAESPTAPSPRRRLSHTRNLQVQVQVQMHVHVNVQALVQVQVQVLVQVLVQVQDFFSLAEPAVKTART